MSEMMSRIHPALKSMITVANGIAKTFGSNCEVVLHDLSHPKTSVIYVCNGHVTGRKVGEGIRDLVWDVLSSPDFEEDALVNYESTAIKDKKVKSTTMVIRDENQKVIGALCINYDVTELMAASHFISNFTNLSTIAKDTSRKVEIKNADILDILNDIISRTILESGKDPRDMAKEEYMNILDYLDEKGVFLIKGAVEWVASKLHLSKFTIYAYLKEIRMERAMEEK